MINLIEKHMQDGYRLLKLEGYLVKGNRASDRQLVTGTDLIESAL